MEEALGREAIKDFQPMQPGDVVATAANTAALEEWVGFKPSTPIETGVQRFLIGIAPFTASDQQLGGLLCSFSRKSGIRQHV